MTGAYTKDEAIEIQTELRQLCMAGGFSLKKWAPTILKFSSVFLRIIVSRIRGRESRNAGLAVAAGRLSHSQFEAVPLKISSKGRFFRTARLFDPLGWFTPVVIRVKILLQSAWLKRLDWDAPLPQVDVCQWSCFLEELPKLEHL